MTEPAHRTVPVTDVFGRSREMGVHLSDEKQVVLEVPPGEAVFVKPDNVDQLISALRDTRAEALRGERWT